MGVLEVGEGDEFAGDEARADVAEPALRVVLVMGWRWAER